MKNKEIKDAIKNAKVFQWEVAEFIGIHEVAFSRKMRHELPDREKQEILDAIEKLKERKVQD